MVSIMSFHLLLRQTTVSLTLCCLVACSAQTGAPPTKDAEVNREPLPATPLNKKMDDATEDDPYFAMLEPEPDPAHTQPTGSLFNDDIQNSIFDEQTRLRIGDIISVKLKEATSATKKQSSSLSKSNAFNLDPITVPGGNLKLAGREIELGLNQSQDFSGDGDASQSNNFTGEISVAVIRVMRNGNLVVRGDKWILINNGKEYIRLTGILRAKDVEDDNTVLSTKLANARMEYSGNGDLANIQQQGWLVKKISDPTIWPF